MRDDEGFLQAIIKDPDDDAVRLIYADWLDDHGEHARAEFIRVQMDLARLPRDDQRLYDLAGRAIQLLEENAAHWLAPFGNNLSDWTFRRGFLDWVRIDARFVLQEAEGSMCSIPIRSAELTEVSGREAELGRCSFLAQLRELTLWEEELTELASLLASPHLEH